MELGKKGGENNQWQGEIGAITSWEKIKPLLPPQTPMTGRPASDHRTIINGMLWVLRTGAPWRDLPKEKYGCHSTISSRFYRWRQAGVWQKIWETLMQQAHAEGRRDWEVHSGDTTVVRAHQHAAGAKGAAKAGFRG